MVHVFGNKEDSDKLELYEIRCDGETTDATEVIYHVGAIKLTGGGWVCRDCGESTVEAETAS